MSTLFWFRQLIEFAHSVDLARHVRGVVDLLVKRYSRSVSAIEILRANLRRLREERDLTQEQIAEKAGLTYRHYQDIEAAARPGLQLATVERLAKAFNLSISELLNPHLSDFSKRKPENKKVRPT